MRKRRWIVPISLVGLVAVGVWVHLLLKNVAPDMPLDASRPDYVITDLRVIEMTEQGNPGRVLEANQLRHYSRNDLTETDEPLVHIFKNGVVEWHIRGEFGRLVNERTEIILDGPVWIDRAEESEDEPVHITTRDLHIFHEERYAETRQPTVIESTQHRIEGIGLEAWFDKPVRVKLLADVRGRHEL